MKFPVVLDGLVSKEDVKHYMTNYLTLQMLSSINSLRDIDTILYTSMGLRLDADDLKVVGSVLLRYKKAEGKIADSDAQIILDIINKYRKKDAVQRVKKESIE